MRRNPHHRSIAMLYPLIGLAAMLSLPGCAAAPVISLASQLMKQPGTAGTSAGSTDMLASLVQRVGSMLPAQPATTATTTTGATAASTSAAATGASGKPVTP